MFLKFLKILFLKQYAYFFFIFFSVLLSLFSYTLWLNVVTWVQNYLQEETKPILWADIVIRNDSDFELDYLQEYTQNLETAKTIEIDTTIFDSQDSPYLYEMVYFSPDYPFYWNLDFEEVNNSWEILVDRDTYDIFWDSIEIFDRDFLVKWVITEAPLNEITIYANNAKIFLPLEDFDTSLNSSNSRITYKHYLNFTGDFDQNVANQIKQLSEENDYETTLLTDRQDTIGEITDRFYLFINFFNLVIFLLTFFIVILSLESFFKKNKSNFWLLNIFWFTKRRIFFYTFVSLFLVFFVAFVTSIILNYIVLFFLQNTFSFLWVYYISITNWFLITLVLLVIGIYSPFYKIQKSSINWLLNDNSDFSNFKKLDYFIYTFLLFAWFFLINFISWIGLFFSVIYSFIIILLIVIFYLIINFVLKTFFKNIFSKVKNFYIFDAIRSTIKPWNVSFLIIFSSIISFISIFVFFVFSGSFINYLTSITQDSNDMFVLNATSQDLPVIEQYLDDDEIYEIVNLRINSINWQSLESYLWVEDVSRDFSREFFSTTNQLDVPIIRWDELSAWEVSVDAEFAWRLDLSIWDIIEFDVAWLTQTLEVVNFREAVRSWTNPFFFFQLDPSDFEDYPKSYILSYRQSEKPENLESILARETDSNLSFIDTKEIIDIVINIWNQILRVVYFALFYIFVFSIISFLVSVLFLKKFKESKIFTLNILWWDFSKLKKSLKLEYIYLISIWFLFSFVFWSLALFLIFSFNSYFGISLNYYIYWVWILLILFFILNIFVYLSLNIKQKN